MRDARDVISRFSFAERRPETFETMAKIEDYLSTAGVAV